MPLLLLDGPMGTELAARGVATPGRGWSAHALVSRPDVVAEIHADYARAGAAVHRANTFRAQPHLFGTDVPALVGTALALARRAAPGARVAGSMAPIEDCYRPDLARTGPDARAIHRAMAEALAGAGADLIVCETFPSAAEARVAVEEAARTGLETWAAFTAGPDAPFMSPEAMEEAARDCVAAGARAVLVSCTAAEATRAYVERIALASVPFGAYANAGIPAEAMTPERYAALARTWIDAGATIVGACCATRPAHVEALARLVREGA